MAEADIPPAYRTLCSHYARGCSLLVGIIVVRTGHVVRRVWRVGALLWQGLSVPRVP